jgi:hypothetical protein
VRICAPVQIDKIEVEIPGNGLRMSQELTMFCLMAVLKSVEFYPV